MNFELNPDTGHERVVQLNYLSTMLLAILLLPILSTGKQRPPKRLGSAVAHMAKLPNRPQRPFLKSFDDLAMRSWDALKRYSAFKALLHLFFVRLLDHLPDSMAERVVFNIVDPGYCKGSGLHRDAEGLIGMFLSVIQALTRRTLEQGRGVH